MKKKEKPEIMGRMEKDAETTTASFDKKPVVYISIALEELDRAIRFVEKTIANYESLDDGLLDDEDIMSGYETIKLIREKLIEYREVLTHD